MASGQTWLGNPPLALPAREQTAGFPEHLTFRPSLGRKLARGAVEGMRMILPLAVVIAVGYLTVMKVIPMAVKHGFVAAFDELMLAGVLYGIGAFLFLVLLKWTLIGRYRPRAEPMWTPFVWKSEAVTSLYESIAVPNFFNFLRATPWLRWRCAAWARASASASSWTPPTSPSTTAWPSATTPCCTPGPARRPICSRIGS